MPEYDVAAPSESLERGPKYRGKLLLLLLLAAGVFFWITGCISTVTPPENPEDPVTVYLVEATCHAGVVLPAPRGGMMDFAYGDWDWYAQNHDSWYHAFDTVLWPTQGTLGQRRLPSGDLSALQPRFPGYSLRPFQASRKKVALLLDRLQARYARNRAGAVYNARFDLTFVKDDPGYWFLHNCNDEVADWTRILGCSVSWVPIRSGLRLAQEE